MPEATNRRRCGSCKRHRGATPSAQQEEKLADGSVTVSGARVRYRQAAGSGADPRRAAIKPASARHADDDEAYRHWRQQEAFFVLADGRGAPQARPASRGADCCCARQLEGRSACHSNVVHGAFARRHGSAHAASRGAQRGECRSTAAQLRGRAAARRCEPSGCAGRCFAGGAAGAEAESGRGSWPRGVHPNAQAPAAAGADRRCVAAGARRADAVR